MVMDIVKDAPEYYRFLLLGKLEISATKKMFNQRDLCVGLFSMCRRSACLVIKVGPTQTRMLILRPSLDWRHHQWHTGWAIFIELVYK